MLRAVVNINQPQIILLQEMAKSTPLPHDLHRKLQSLDVSNTPSQLELNQEEIESILDYFPPSSPNANIQKLQLILNQAIQENMERNSV